MNFFEIINEVLAELEMPRVKNFNNLILPEHDKIKRIINRTHKSIISSEKWWFLKGIAKYKMNYYEHFIKYPQDASVYLVKSNSQDAFNINDLNSALMFNNPYLCYSDDENVLNFMLNGIPRSVEVFYEKTKYVIGADKKGKDTFEEAGDKSIIPAEYAEPLLIYGTCYRYIRKPNDEKYKHWKQLYLEALANLRASGNNCRNLPKIEIERL